MTGLNRPLTQAEHRQRVDAARASAEKRRRSHTDYLKEIRQLPFLDADEERELGRRMKEGDAGARERVLNAHLRLAANLARQQRGYGLPVEDLTAAANLGLLKAAEKYDPSRNTRFATFAIPYIQGEIYAHILQNWSIVRTGTSRDQKRLFFALRSMRAQMGDLESGEIDPEKAQAIADKRGVKTKAVVEMSRRLAGGDASLNAASDDEGDQPLDRLTGAAASPEDELLEADEKARRGAALARAIAKLPPREQAIIRARWGSKKERTLQDLAQEMGVSAERVRQLEQQAMRRLKASMQADPLAKRTPGAPLSEAELEQRREAARSRWGIAGAAAAGAAASALGEAVRQRAKQAAAEHQVGETLRQGWQRAEGARIRAAKKVQRHQEVIRAGEREIRKPWPLKAYAQHLRPRIARSDDREVRGALLLRQQASEGVEQPRRGAGRYVGGQLQGEEGWYVAGQARTARGGRTVIPERLRAPMDDRLREGWVVDRNLAVRQPLPFPTNDDLKQMRAEMRAGRADRHAKFAAKTMRRGWAEYRTIRQAAQKEADRLATRIPKGSRGKIGVAALAGGALAGGLAWGLQKLAKAAPEDPTDPTDEGIYREPEPSQEDVSTPAPGPINRAERELARSLARLFRSWLEKPGDIGARDAVAEALAPLEFALWAGAEGAIPPARVIRDMAEGEGAGRYLGVSFEARNPEVEAQLRRYAGDRVTEISNQSRETIRLAVIAAAQTGRTIPEQARLIREAVGLHSTQQDWVSSYRRQLETLDPRVLDRALRDRRFDGPIARAIRTGTPIPPEDIDRYVDAYHRRALAYRATTIARTEALRGANFGQVETTRQMLNVFPHMTVEKVWIATKDDRTRDAHRELDGKMVVGMDTPFRVRDPETGQQVEIRWPHDDQAPASMVVNCRCTIGFRMIPKPGAGRMTQLTAEAL